MFPGLEAVRKYCADLLGPRPSVAPPPLPAEPPVPDPAIKAVDQKRAESDALERLKLARSFLTSTNRVIIGFVISLALISWQSIKDLPPTELFRVWQLKKTVSTSKDNVSTVLKSGSLSNLTTLTRDRQKTQSDYNFDLKAIREPVAVKLPLGGELSLPGRFWLPIPGLLLSAILLGYLQYCRRRHFRLVARAVAILRTDVGYREDQLVDLMPAQPWWWLLPLPRTQDQSPAADLVTIAGWQPVLARLRFWAGLIAAGLFSYHFLTLAAAFLYAQIFATPREALLIQGLATLFAVATILVAWDWFRPLRWPDHHPVDRDPNLYTRRRLIGTAVCGPAALLAVPGWNLYQSFSQARRAPDAIAPASRFARLFRRRREVVVPFSEIKAALPSFSGDVAIVLNKKRNIVHLLRRDPAAPANFTASHGTWLPRARAYFRPLDVLSSDSASLILPPVFSPKKNRFIQPAMDNSKHVLAIEILAHDLLRGIAFNPADPAAATVVPHALKLIDEAIRLAPQNLRMYDLRAAVSVRFERRGDFFDSVGRLTRLTSPVQNGDVPTVRNGDVLKGSPSADNPPSDLSLRLRRIGAELVTRILEAKPPRRPGLRHERSRHRYACTPEQVFRPRPASHRRHKPRPDFEAVLAARLRKWKEPASLWHKKVTDPKWNWKLSGPAPRTPRCKL